MSKINYGFPLGCFKFDFPFENLYFVKFITAQLYSIVKIKMGNTPSHNAIDYTIIKAPAEYEGYKYGITQVEKSAKWTKGLRINIDDIATLVVVDIILPAKLNAVDPQTYECAIQRTNNANGNKVVILLKKEVSQPEEIQIADEISWITVVPPKKEN